MDILEYTNALVAPRRLRQGISTMRAKGTYTLVTAPDMSADFK